MMTSPGVNMDDSASYVKPKAPWSLDTLWFKRNNGEGSSRDADIPPDVQSYDFADLPLTPPDSTEAPYTQSGARIPLATPRKSSLQSQPASPLRPSKNDIFNSPTSWIAPPGKFHAQSQAEIVTPPTKNSLFYSPTSATTPSTSLRLSQDPALKGSPVVATQQTTGRKHGHTRNSSLGRASSEERLQEEARIRNTKDVDFRLCPTQEYILGEGRHCTVYLGSYWSRKAIRQHQQCAGQLQDPAFPAWELCAIKRLHADRQSQLLGLDEAFALRRLGSHPNIIQLIDIRDEVEFSSSALALDNTHTSQSAPIAIGPKVGNPSAVPARYAVNVLRHPRSISDMMSKDGTQHAVGLSSASEDLDDAQLAADLVRHAGIALQPDAVLKQDLAVPTFQGQKSGGTALDTTTDPQLPPSVRPTASAPVVRKASPAMSDPPRLLILLELLPNNLALYAKRHNDRIDFEQWLSWAKQMAEAVAFLHSKGCVHADIKKENMLLTDELDIKLCDFNSAVFPIPGDPPRDGLGLGTPAYCAPELSRATGGPGATSFSYPIDVFSLGAVLYSLAIGCEPFSQARSVMEMLHRKRAFFESEENDRTSRMMVEAGSSPNSQPASRRSSLRGRKHPVSYGNFSEDTGNSPTVQTARSLTDLLQRSNSGSHRVKREASSDSLESVASGITIMTGRNPSSLAISRLLEPTLEPRGLLASPSSLDRKSSLVRYLNEADVKRRSSIGRGHKQSPVVDRVIATNRMPQQQQHANESPGAPHGVSLAMQSTKSLEPPLRPEPTRRRSSCGHDSEDQAAVTAAQHATHDSPSRKNLLPMATNAVTSNRDSTRLPRGRHTCTLSESSVPHHTENLFRADQQKAPVATAADADNFDRHHTQSSTMRAPVSVAKDNVETAAYLEAYSDGTPAIFLPGGGRLPDKARDLLRTMLAPDPDARPTAQQVLAILHTFNHFYT